MTQASITMEQERRGYRLSDRAVGRLLLTAIAVSQIAWLGALGYGAWHFLF